MNEIESCTEFPNNLLMKISLCLCDFNVAPNIYKNSPDYIKSPFENKQIIELLQEKRCKNVLNLNCGSKNLSYISL